MVKLSVEVGTDNFPETLKGNVYTDNTAGWVESLARVLGQCTALAHLSLCGNGH